jgi:hypothetical protein
MDPLVFDLDSYYRKNYSMGCLRTSVRQVLVDDAETLQPKHTTPISFFIVFLLLAHIYVK